MRREAYASLQNALEVLLSRTSLDLGPSVSHHTLKHPIETQKLSPLLCSMRVDPTKTVRREGPRGGVSVKRPVSGSECGLGGMDGSPMPLIAVSVTLKVVLTMAIEALHVAPKPR